MAATTLRILWGSERAGTLQRISLSPGRLASLGLALLLAVGAGGPLLFERGQTWRQQSAQAEVLQERQGQLAERLALIEQSRQPLASLVLANERSLASLLTKQQAPMADGPGSAAAPPPAERSARSRPENPSLDALWTRARTSEADLARLLDYWQHAERRLRHTPAIRPVQVAWLSSSFGVRVDPMSGALLMHKGLDLAGQSGMSILAPADGVVIFVGTRGGYGQTVVIDHGWGLQTHFAHLSRFCVRAGDAVRRRQVVAEMGNTGKSTGPHLHYEVRLDGYPIDPRKFILD